MWERLGSRRFPRPGSREDSCRSTLLACCNYVSDERIGCLLSDRAFHDTQFLVL
jgi:hypothetical protein